ncbi:MAG: ATP-grasp domain-containing protein [Eudoraea sp.]|uniref:ATP-grasp domain-containing protein n=1 Tax=Eudoraea sp. TaxID=1979955 RepID=UPI00326480EA
MNIAVTGVGGGVGQNIIKSLEHSDYNVVALDGDHLAVGLYLSKTAYLIPYANKDNYIPKLLEICKDENISLLFPGLDPELMPLSLNRHLFDKIGTKVVVSRPEVITIFEDIQLAFEHLMRSGVNVPITFLAEKFNPNKESYPFILRQRVGSARSKNKYLIRNSIEWEATLKKIESDISNYIIMEYIEGDEYTCGSINLNGSCEGVIVMQRILRGGETYKCFTIKNDVIEEEVRKILEAIKPFGACNVEFKLKDGKPYVFEVNARCSGTTAARACSGFNEPKMIADYLLKGIKPEYSFREQTILRYWKELLVENDLIDELKQQQVIKR